MKGFTELTKIIGWSFMTITMCIVIVVLSVYKITENQNTSYVKEISKPVFICGTSSLSMPHRQGNYSQEGELLFKANCASCHKLYKDATGPLLWGITEKRDSLWLRSFIRNSQLMIENKDSTALALYLKWDKRAMNSFEHFTDQDIDNILNYLN